VHPGNKDMPPPADTALRDELRDAGLPAEGAVAELLALLRAVQDTHLDLAAAQRLAAEGGLGLLRSEVAALMEALARANLLGRVPVPGGAVLYDTEPRPHSHLMEEASGSIVDLDVTPETLAAIIRQTLSDHPGRVEVLLRIRAPRPGEPGAPQLAKGPGRPRAVR
jgi:Fur family iron response transcriptional regulator